MSETLTDALAERDKPDSIVRVENIIAANRTRLERLLKPYGETPETFEARLWLARRDNPMLDECDPQSLAGAAFRCAQLGLDPGPLGLAAIVPYKREATLIVMYRGFVELAYRTGQVKDVYAELVHEGDEFRVRRGTTPKIEHDVEGPAGDRAIVAAYAVARLRSGGTVSNVIWPDDWQRAKQHSQTGRRDRGPWVEHFPAMVRKTAVRRLEPFLPKTPALAGAVAWDDTVAPPLDELLVEPEPTP